jgi:hypothetical protein
VFLDLGDFAISWVPVSYCSIELFGWVLPTVHHKILVGSTCNALVLLAGPQDVPYVYCLFYVIFVPLRWIYYRYKKWHYYLLVSPLLSHIGNASSTRHVLPQNLLKFIT